MSVMISSLSVIAAVAVVLLVVERILTAITAAFWEAFR